MFPWFGDMMKNGGLRSLHMQNQFPDAACLPHLIYLTYGAACSPPQRDISFSVFRIISYLGEREQTVP